MEHEQNRSKNTNFDYICIHERHLTGLNLYINRPHSLKHKQNISSKSSRLGEVQQKTFVYRRIMYIKIISTLLIDNTDFVIYLTHIPAVV